MAQTVRVMWCDIDLETKTFVRMLGLFKTHSLQHI